MTAIASLLQRPDTVSAAIQLALAPVFLLTAIAGLLNVMTGRLSRIIDRGRALTDCRDGESPPVTDAVRRELQGLEQRRHYTSVAITACTIAALLVCLVVAALFVETVLDVSLRWLVGGLFVASTLALVVGLASFLREVHAATRTVRIVDHRRS